MKNTYFIFTLLTFSLFLFTCSDNEFDSTEESTTSSRIKYKERSFTEKLITMDEFFDYRNRWAKTIENFPAEIKDQPEVFGYTFREFRDYILHLEKLALDNNVSLDSIQFILAENPPVKAYDYVSSRTLVIKPTYNNYEYVDGHYKKIESANIKTGSVPLFFGLLSGNDDPVDSLLQTQTVLDYSHCCPLPDKD